MKLFPGVTLVSACLVVFSASTGAIAQSAAAPGESAPPGNMERRAFIRPTERVEARLAYIRTALKIDERQQSQWEAYASLVRSNAKEMEQRFQSRRAARPGPGGPGARPERPRLSAIERLERQQSVHAEAIVRLNRQLEVQKPLYAALSPEQRKIADEVLNPRMGPGGGHPGRRGHPGHGGPMGGRPMMGPGGFG